MAKHVWILDEDGLVDIWQLVSGYCNGPRCAACDESFCHHCTDIDALDDCASVIVVQEQRQQPHALTQRVETPIVGVDGAYTSRSVRRAHRVLQTKVCLMGEHEPCEVEYETVEDIGGLLVTTGTRVEVRCGCTETYRYAYGHETVWR